MMLRFEGGAKGMLWCSQVAPGNENGLALRIYGEKGGLEWKQEHPNHLTYSPFGEAPRTITRGGHGSSAIAGRVTRIPPGHPEGYLEGFANVYSDVAEAITARLEGREPDKDALDFPTVMDGVRGVKFIESAVESVLGQGVRTADIMSDGMKQVGTKEMGDLIAEELEKRNVA